VGPAQPISEAVEDDDEDARCVLLGYAHDSDDPKIRALSNVTWCGERVSLMMTWTFLDASHALLAIRNGSRIPVCAKCRAEIRKLLQEGSDGADR
jgi:hypothetical protein